MLFSCIVGLAAVQAADSVIETENPNGYDPLFNWTIIHSNEFLQSYNVTYLDLINKPVQIKILGQSLYEDGLLWYEQMVIYGNDWISKFNDFTDFTSDFDSKIMIEWARDMEDIIEETMSIVRRGMVDMEQIIYPWGIYESSDIEATYISPYLTAVNEILAWSGDATFRYWTMLFGLGGWVPTGRGWIEKWNTDFEWHRISDVSRDIRSMAEDWKVNLQSGLSDWEVILCGPRDETGTCGWLDEPNFDFIVEYSLDYVLIFLDKIDEAIEWFSLVIGNILDATINKNDTDTEETAARTSFRTLY